MTALLAVAVAAAAPEACALLAAQEVAAVQGEAPSEARAGAREEGPLRVSSCVFVLPTFAKSLALEVTRGPDGEARRRWKEIFHSRRERGDEPGEERVKPKRIRGLGEEAFWLAEKPSGALYVLRQNAFVRLSLGGPDPRDVKVARAKALLRRAMPRL